MVVLSAEDFESLLETLAILQDPKDRQMFEQARREADEGDVTEEDEMAALCVSGWHGEPTTEP